MSSVDTQLHAALARALNGVPHHELQRHADALSARYRNERIDDSAPGMRDALDALAYAVVRMPATFHAIHAALAAVDAPITTHLDLGGGTGAAAWAAAARWPGLRTEIVERQPAAVDLGKTLAAGNDWRWTLGDLRTWSASGPADLLTVAYVLNELTTDTRRALIDTVVHCAQTIVLVEPGTPAAHRRILEARGQLLAHGLRIAAPCPHEASCPVTWCHFATRLARTELHRSLKHGTRNFEDEKFTYLVATRLPTRPAANRVIGRPLHPKNRVVLDLCTAAGTAERTVVPKSSPSYRAARRTLWGDTWP